jgi:hypothetical protein
LSGSSARGVVGAGTAGIVAAIVFLSSKEMQERTHAMKRHKPYSKVEESEREKYGGAGLL